MWPRCQQHLCVPAHSVLGEVPGTWGAGWARARDGGAPRPGAGAAAALGRVEAAGVAWREAARKAWTLRPARQAPQSPAPCGGPHPEPGLSLLSPSPFVPTPRMVATLRGLSPGWGAWGGKGWWPRSPSREVCCFLATRELVPLAHRHHHGQHRQAPLGPSVPSLGGGCWPLPPSLNRGAGLVTAPAGGHDLRSGGT